MALTVQTNGSGPSNIIQASWFNDYYNLLTGAMHDQPVTLDYRHGSNNSTPSLLLRGDGFNNLIRGLKSDNVTEAFHIDSTGNLTLAGSMTSGAISGSTGAFSSDVTITGNLTVSGGQVTGKNGAYTTFGNGANGDISLHPGTANWVYLYGGNSGSVHVNGTGQLVDTGSGNSYGLLVGAGATAGRQIFVGTSTPTGANEGDIWIKA